MYRLNDDDFSDDLRCVHGEVGECADCAIEQAPLMTKHDEPAWWEQRWAGMRTMHPALALAFQKLPNYNCVVAGGAALNAHNARDIDVFFFDRGQWEAAGAAWLPPSAMDASYPDFALWTGHLRVPYGKRGIGYGVTVQGIYSGEATVEELLARFDTTTHQCAATREGEFVTGAQWTPPSVQPRVLSLRTPHSTAARIERIAARYGFPVHDADVRQLEAAKILVNALADAARKEAA